MCTVSERIPDGDGLRGAHAEIFLLVAQWHRANEEPAILSVSLPQAHFILERFPSGHAREPVFHDSWKVFGTDGARGLCNFLRERETRIIQPTLINKINSAIRPNGPGHRGDFVDNEPQYLVAAPQFLRGPGSH